MKCNFSANMQEEGDVKLDGLVVPKKISFATWNRCSRRVEIMGANS
jgi:hypothetical protein